MLEELAMVEPLSYSSEFVRICHQLVTQASRKKHRSRQSTFIYVNVIGLYTRNFKNVASCPCLGKLCNSTYFLKGYFYLVILIITALCGVVLLTNVDVNSQQ